MYSTYITVHNLNPTFNHLVHNINAAANNAMIPIYSFAMLSLFFPPIPTSAPTIGGPERAASPCNKYITPNLDPKTDILLVSPATPEDGKLRIALPRKP